MFSSNPLKIIFLAAVLFASACSFFQSKPDANATPTPFVAEELKSAVPFATKEPTVYQTEIVVTAANQAEDKFFTARNEENRLTIFNYQTESETALLQIGDGQTFIIHANQKIYTEKDASARSETAEDFFTAEWLNQKTNAKFETLVPENNLARYRVSLDEAANSEIIIFVDREISLPVRQEFYSVNDGQKISTLTVELKNFKAEAEAKFFELPKDYRKVSSNEFYKMTRADQIQK